MTPIQKAEKENTVESWWNAFTMVPEGSEEEAYCINKMNLFPSLALNRWWDEF